MIIYKIKKDVIMNDKEKSNKEKPNEEELRSTLASYIFNINEDSFREEPLRMQIKELKNTIDTLIELNDFLEKKLYSTEEYLDNIKKELQKTRTTHEIHLQEFNKLKSDISKLVDNFIILHKNILKENNTTKVIISEALSELKTKKSFFSRIIEHLF